MPGFSKEVVNNKKHVLTQNLDVASRTLRLVVTRVTKRRWEWRIRALLNSKANPVDIVAA